MRALEASRMGAKCGRASHMLTEESKCSEACDGGSAWRLSTFSKTAGELSRCRQLRINSRGFAGLLMERRLT